jgi:hypothetical protein
MKISHLGLLAGLLFAGIVHAADAPAPTKLNTTADHSKFKELQREFGSGSEVTKACLTCHTEAALQIHRTKHWTWELLNPATQQRLGKKNVINNYCLSAGTNLGSCATCHVGYGWTDASFDFKSQENVDCLICHDTSGNYKKLPNGGLPPVKDTESPPGSGKIVKAIDLAKIAQKVGKTSRDTAAPATFSAAGATGSNMARWIRHLPHRTRRSMSIWMPPDSTSPAAPATRRPLMMSPAAVIYRLAKTRKARI